MTRGNWPDVRGRTRRRRRQSSQTITAKAAAGHYYLMVMVEGNSRQLLPETTAQEAKPIISKLKPLDSKDLVQYLRPRRADQVNKSG